jgi:pimeloyl-ACP methyl ester carboxylesterase
MDLREALSLIDVPTLVITGRFDPSTPPELGREIAAKIPGARCIELPLAHMPQLEQPGTSGDVVQHFLER